MVDGRSRRPALDARTLHDVAGLLAAEDPGAPTAPQQAGAGDSSRTLDPRNVVAPAPYVVGRIEGPRLVVDGPTGVPTGLDAIDLALLEAVSTALVVADLDVSVDPDEVRARLARLGALGCLVVRGVGSPLDAVPRPRYLQEIDRRALIRSVDPDRATSPAVPPGRVPIYFPWPEDVTPLLSLGMLAAAARSFEGGRLNEGYEIRRPELASSFLRDVEGRAGPAILICPDYVFTLPENIEVARRAKAMNPELLVIHGGPSSPTYEQDVADFFAAFGDVADILCRGEGEELLCELLDVVQADLPQLDPDRLAEVRGITFRDPRSGAIVRTPDRDRIADLDRLPSPYLTGEFDHIDPTLWIDPPMFETNRGCPYGCTYCDWGSATMSRIRRFDIDRVAAEFEWAVARGHGLLICDANFGILARDVEIARRIAVLRATYDGPSFVLVTPSKNRIDHLTEAFDVLYEAGGHPAGLDLVADDRRGDAGGDRPAEHFD